MANKYWTAPGGKVSTVYKDMLNAGHTLIAGAAGSGKSTVLSGLIHTALCYTPSEYQFILIDPKRIDMSEYSDMPHVLRYATEPQQIKAALAFALDLMENRYKDMAKRCLKEHDGSVIFVIIDEAADLMTNPTNKRTFSPMIQRLAQLGRAAHITVIMATQCCLRTVIDSAIKANFASRLALRTASAQDSRNIIEQAGAEQLPNPRTEGRACGIWRNGADTILCEMHRYTEEERASMIEYWHRNRKPRSRFSLFGRKSA